MSFKQNINDIKKNYSLGIIGGGQLALMLTEAAKKRDLEVCVQTKSCDDPAGLKADHVIEADPLKIRGNKSLINECEKIIFENDLHLATLKNLLPSYKKVFIILLKNEQRQIKLSESVLKFKQDLVSEFVEDFDNVEQIDPYSLENTFKNTNEIDIIYPGVGENYDFITEFKNLHHKKFFNLVRDEDLFAWKFAKRGFFKFKENIPKINQRILENFSKNNF